MIEEDKKVLKDTFSFTLINFATEYFLPNFVLLWELNKHSYKNHSVLSDAASGDKCHCRVPTTLNAKRRMFPSQKRINFEKRLFKEELKK